MVIALIVVVWALMLALALALCRASAAADISMAASQGDRRQTSPKLDRRRASAPARRPQRAHS
jgi:hypothetical protein